MTDLPTQPPTVRVPRWPAEPAWLLDTTRCPSCFSVLRAVRCDECGLDVAAPDGERVLEAARALHGWEVARRNRLEAMWDAQGAREAQAAWEAQAASEAQAVWETQDLQQSREPAGAALPAPAVLAEVPAATAAPTPAAPGPAAAAPGPAATAPAADGTTTGVRRSGVQVALLTIGVVLVSVAAVVFLLVAYLIATLEVRSVIIGIASALVLGTAALLRRRRLPGTAEGVASVAVVLLLLDVWIVRANGLFGTGEADALWYTAIAFAVVAAVLGLVRRSAGLRVPGFAAAVIAPTAGFLGGLAVDPATATGGWLGGLAAAIIGVGVARRGAAPEQIAARATGFVGLGLAFAFAAWALPDAPAGALWAFAGVAGVAAILAVVHAVPSIRPWALAAASIAGAAAALAPVAALAGDADVAIAGWLAPASAASIAIVAAAARRRTATREWDAAVIAAGTVAAISALPALVSGIGWLSMLAVGSASPWSLPADAPLPSYPGDALLILVPPGTAALAALALAASAVAVGGVLGAPLVRRPLTTVAAGLTGAAAMFGATAAPVLWFAVGGFLVIASVALALGAVGALRRIGGAVPILATTGILAAVVALGLGRISEWTWPMAAAWVLALAIVSRAVAARLWSPGARIVVGAIHLGLAATLVVAFTWLVPDWLSGAASFSEPWTLGATWTAVVAAPLIASAVLLPRLHDADRAAATLPLAVAASIGAFAVAVGGLRLGWLPAALVATALIGTLRVARPAVVRVALAVLGPVTLGAAATAIDGSAPVPTAAALAGAALASAALAHLVVRGTDRPRRIAWTVATLAVATWALVSAAITAVSSPGTLWLSLLLLTPVPIVCAALDGDPVGGRSSSRHLAWLTLPLAVGTVWAWLGDHDVDVAEAYTLPLAAFLGISAGLIAWRRPVGTTGSTGRTALVVAALAVAVLPTAALAGSSELRTLVLVSAGAIAGLASIGVPSEARGIPARLLVVVTAWVALALPSTIRGAAVAAGEPSVLPIEFWPVLGLVGAVPLAWSWPRDGVRPAGLPGWIVAGSLTLAVIPTTIAITSGDQPEIRAVVTLTAIMAVHVAASSARTGPFAGALLRWVSLADAIVVGLIALIAPVDPQEVVYVPIGLGLTVAGAVRLTRNPTLRSWPALGPGLAVLLVPALIADWVDVELWRIVALGVTALAAMLVGLLARLQAPFVLGGAVLVVHGVQQLWPWISWLYEAVWWWLWLGIAGAILIALAATYERQLRVARRTVRSISELR